MKNQINEYREALNKSTEFKKKGNWTKEDWPYIPSSNMADAFLIGLNWLYHRGRLPYEMRKSRGYSWLVDGEKVTVTNAFDHREGVQAINEVTK